MFVLMRIESWATATPKSAGTICFIVATTAESRSAVLRLENRGIIPIFQSAGTWNASWRTPPAITANASA